MRRPSFPLPPKKKAEDEGMKPGTVLASVGLFLFSWSLAAAQEPRFRAATSDWVLPDLRLDQFADDALVHLAGKENKIVLASDLVWLRRQGVTLPEYPPPPFLLSAGGERLPIGEKFSWKENRLH